MPLKLRASIVLAVVVGLVIPAGVSSLIILDQREQALAHRLAEDHRRLLDIVRYGMQEPLWNLNQQAAQPLFASVLSDERVTALTVRDNKFGEFLSEDYRQRRRGRQFQLRGDVVYNNNVIGYVWLQMDSGQLDAEIADDRAAFAWMVLAQLLLSMVLIVALLQVRLLAPIRRLTRESHQLAQRELSEPFIWHRTDELGSLGSSLERTRRALLAAFDEIEAKNRALQHDIEQRVRTEQELQRHREHLEELVRERTAELTEAKERAEIASHAKSTFLASMSHELRTPLNAVLGYAQVLRREPDLGEHQSAGLDTILRSGEHLLTLINDLLDLSKIEAGKFDLHERAIVLRNFLHVVVDIIRIRAQQKGLEFLVNLAPDLPYAVMVDDVRLRQVLLNLLGNAIKFTDSGEVSLRVHPTPLDRAHVHLSFEVCDTGIGMGADQLERIFQPFEQVGEARHRFGGTGLGLSISRQLVRMMGGDIRVSSEPGRGSVFGFELLVRLVENGEMAELVREDAALAAVSGKAPASASPPIGVDLVAPPPEEMDALYRLALAGNMRDIRHYAARLAQLDARYQPFADLLQELAAEYQSKAIVTLVEQYMPAGRQP